MALLGQVRETELTAHGTSRPRGANKNAMALLGHSRDSSPPMAPLGHVELAKCKKFQKAKTKKTKKNENENKNENNACTESAIQSSL